MRWVGALGRRCWEDEGKVGEEDGDDESDAGNSGED